MKMIFQFSFLAIFLAPSMALAAGGGEPAGLSSLLWPAVNFSIFVLVMRKLYRKHVSVLLRGRSASVKNHLDRARIDLAEAEESYQGLYNKLTNIEVDKRELFARFDTEGANLSKIILEQAGLQSQRVEADSKRQIDSELSQATKGLKRTAIEEAIKLAEAKLKDGLSVDQDKLLRSDALSALIQGGDVSGRQGA